MLLIAHRGNLDGPDPRENEPAYVERALTHGFHVEVDVWARAGRLYLGHDGPDHPVAEPFLARPRVWCHAKDVVAMRALLAAGAHCFFHERDAVALTSRKFLWTHPEPDAVLTDRSVLVVRGPELPRRERFYGVCGDYAGRWSCSEAVVAAAGE